ATASVSADGRMFSEGVVSSNGDANMLVLQPLLNDGHRNGTPALITVSNSISSVDCSDVLTGSIRDVIYRASKIQGIDTIQNQLFLQKVNATTGKAVGIAQALTSIETTIAPIAEPDQSVAIDPQGKFVLYTAFASACGKNVLKFQPIDSSGNKKGSPTV